MTLYFYRQRTRAYIIRGIAHVATATSETAVFAGDYRTLCGARINPRRWALVDAVEDDRELCESCKRRQTAK